MRCGGGVSFVKTDGAGSADTKDGELFWQVGLTLDWNVLDGGAFIASMNQSKARVLEPRVAAKQHGHGPRGEHPRHRGDGHGRHTSASGSRCLQAETADENFALVNEAYLDGESTLLDLIDAQDQLISANTSDRQALYQFLSDLLTLEQSIAYFPFLEDPTRGHGFASWRASFRGGDDESWRSVLSRS